MIGKNIYPISDTIVSLKFFILHFFFSKYIILDFFSELFDYKSMNPAEIRKEILRSVGQSVRYRVS